MKTQSNFKKLKVRLLKDNMAYIVVSSCPQCGAPVWADSEDQCKNNPPQHRFTCECRFSKKENSYPQDPEFVPYPIQPYPIQPYPFQPYPIQPYQIQLYPIQLYPIQPYPLQPWQTTIFTLTSTSDPTY